MSTAESRRSQISKRAIRRACPERCRRDGWNPERQLRFLDTLASTGSVTRAARAAGMSRESAYRLRARADSALFAAAWDKALRRQQQEGHEVGGKARGVRLLRSAISRANPPKVTKFVKFVSPGFRPRSPQSV
jgi:hypothetical protein